MLMVGRHRTEVMPVSLFIDCGSFRPKAVCLRDIVNKELKGNSQCKSIRPQRDTGTRNVESRDQFPGEAIYIMAQAERIIRHRE